MRVKLKNSLVNKDPVYSASCDSLEDIFPLLPTFNYVRSHLRESHFTEAYYFANTAYFFCDLEYPKKWRAAAKVNIEIDPIEVNSSFYEWADFTQCDQNSSLEAIVILLNKRYVGLYVAEHNILYASDWVHSISNLPLAKRLIEELYSRNIFRKKGVKPLPEKPIELKTKFDITLGCDPEFEVLNHGEVLSASELEISSTETKVGVDGSGDQIELRPTHKKKPEELVKEVKNLLEEFGRRYRLGLGVKGDYYPLGGHIHFGGSPPLPCTSAFIYLLDEWLGKPLIGLSGDARGNYKGLGKYELKYWGFEYRSLPAAIFQSPKVATAVLRICRVLAEEYYNGEGVDTVPSKEEVERLRLEEEIKVLQEFKETYYSNSNKDIYHFWEIKVPRLRVYFRDEWSPSAKNLIWQQLKEAGLDDEDITIFFFGLREDRGDAISGFYAPGYTIVEMPEGSGYSSAPEALVFWFGLPYKARTSSLEVLRYLVERCIKVVKEELNY